jgi:oxygen-independent coproporphyrinogen-3 oxidase
MVEAMLQEVELRKNYFDNIVIPCSTRKRSSAQANLQIEGLQVKPAMTDEKNEATLYFGGGTPSLLQPAQIAALAQKVIQTFGVKNVTEFTVEINPDDATTEYLQALRNIGVNRLSIGIQSFFDDDLQRVNRRHTAQQAKLSVQNAQKVGFKNISVDLIYGLPQMTLEHWRSNLETAFSLNIQHLSAYALSVEERTPFGVQQRKGQLFLPTENEVAEQSALLDELSAQHNFTRYEISNFGKKGFFSQHNTAYWQQKPYIGLGPSAHSYSGAQRQNNVANNALYMERIAGCHSALDAETKFGASQSPNREIAGQARNDKFFELENLTSEQRYNEYIFTGLRTMWGIDLNYIEQVFDKKLYDYCCKNLSQLIDNKIVILKNNKITIPQNKWIVADSIIVDLIWA